MPNRAGCALVTSFVLLAVVAASAPAATTPAATMHAAGAASATARDVHGWMPDVAERVASLRERTQRAAAEAGAREVAAGDRGWRYVAAAPAAGRGR